MVPRIPRNALLIAVISSMGALPPGLFAADGIEQKPIRELHRAVSSAAFAEGPARTKGVVIWTDRTDGKRFYLHDGVEGIWVTFQGNTWPEFRDELEVEGLLTRGLTSPILAEASFKRLGQGEIPTHELLNRASFGDMALGYLNGRPVELHGWVRSAEMINPTTLALVLNSNSYRIKARVSNVTDVDLESLVASRIAIRGVANPVKARGTIDRLVEAQALAANFLPQIPHYMSELIEIEILCARQEDFWVEGFRGIRPWDRVVTPLNEVFNYHPGETVRGDWIRVQGQVIHLTDGIAYLADGASGLAVKGAGVARLQPGEWVQAAGYPDLDNGLPILSDAMLKPAEDPLPPVTPGEVMAGQLLDDVMHADFVAVTGKLLDRMQAPVRSPQNSEKKDTERLILALQAPQSVFTAELEGPAGRALLPDVEIGSTLRVSGVCLVQTDSSGTATSFKILVPNANHIKVVEPASIFTVKRLLIVLSILLTVLLAVAVLMFLVARRNIRLRAEMHERQAVTAERNRLARDLHDTLEQGLTGIQLHLQGITSATRHEPSVEIQERLGTVRSLVQKCHAETRQSIWNLRSSEPEHFNLGEALERVARSLIPESSMQIELTQKREGSVSIPPGIEDNLFRIGQEAITNAVKHARASKLRIDLVVTPQSTLLIIDDDGCGISESRGLPGHFGLVGMHERADRIGGHLCVTNNAWGGCRVRVEAPLRAAASTFSTE